MKVHKLKDQWDLVECSQFPKDVATFPKYKEFNPVQSRVFEIYNEDANCVIMSQTSSGKTCCAEMFMGHEIRNRGRKAMFLGPLRSLTQEKIDEWTDENHHFKNCNVSICTGDYRLTPRRRKELEESDLIIMTSEMLNSRCRNYKSENNKWLQDVGTLIVDEAHLLTVPGRGDHLEVGLMKFAQINPNARIVFLSATIPNAEEISGWLSESLTGLDTFFIESEYRPVPLKVHYPVYHDSGTYGEKEEAKIEKAIEILDEYPDDKFLVFVHSKRTGNQLVEELEMAHIESQFHNADVDKGDRIAIEKAFRDTGLRVIVATSTLAWGLNLPARRVCIVGVHRGLQEVEWYDIGQMKGRAGRVGLDDEGDVHIIVPNKHTAQHIARIETPQPITSRLLDFVGDGSRKHYKTLAFHLVSEIHHGEIKTIDDIHDWYEKSLACYQSRDLDDRIIDNTVESLVRTGAIKRNYQSDGGVEYETTAIGTISSMMYYSPYDVADLRKNFQSLFQAGLEGNDMAVAMALGDVDSNRATFVSNAEREHMISFAARVQRAFGKKYTVSKTPEGRRNEAAIKAGFAYYILMKDMKRGAMKSLCATAENDMERTTQVLSALDSMGAKWRKEKWLEVLGLRIKHKVPAEIAYLAQLPKVGKVRGEKLHKAGIKSVQDVADNPAKVKQVLGDTKTTDNILKEARLLMLKE